MKTHLLLALTLAAGTLPAIAAEADTRGGTCADAKSQYEYFCEKKGYSEDIMLNAPIACNNAKRNMAAACDGKAEADKPYAFDDRKSQ